MTPIERAARALAVELARQDGSDVKPEEVRFYGGLRLDYIDQTDVDFAGLVRAVLQAIREPSPEMVDDGMETVDDAHFVRTIWRAMIDAAMKADAIPASNPRARKPVPGETVLIRTVDLGLSGPRRGRP